MLVYPVAGEMSKTAEAADRSKVAAMENPGILNILKYVNAVKLERYSHRDYSEWVLAELRQMADINGANSMIIGSVRRGEVLDLLVDILTSPDTDWMKYDSPGEEEWYVLPSLIES